MVGSDYKAQDCDGYYCSDYAGVSKCVFFPRVEGDDARDNAEAGQDQDIYFRVAKESE